MADRETVLRFLSDMMDGDIEGATIRDRLRAAELLGKHFGVFDGDPDGEAITPIIIEGGDLLA